MPPALSAIDWLLLLMLLRLFVTAASVVVTRPATALISLVLDAITDVLASTPDVFAAIVDVLVTMLDVFAAMPDVFAAMPDAFAEITDVFASMPDVFAAIADVLVKILLSAVVTRAVVAVMSELTLAIAAVLDVISA